METQKKRKIVIKKPIIELQEVDDGMVGFSTKNFRVLKHLVNLIGDTTDEVDFKLCETGLSISCMDCSHISYLICNLPKNFFDDFKCDVPKTYGINMKSLIKIFNIAKINIGLTVIFNEDTIDFFIKSDELEKQYTIKQLFLNTESLEIQDIDYDYKIVLKSTDFYNITNELQDLSNSCEFKLKNNTIQFKADGDLGTVRIKVAPEEYVQNNEDKFSKFLFNAKYLFNYAKGRQLSDHVSLEFSKDLPLKMTYDLGDDGTIYSYLAPKID